MSFEVKFVNKIPDVLDKLREEKGMTKVEISRKIGMTKQNLDKISKAKNPHIVSLIKISCGIGCDITDLFEYQIDET